MNDAGQHHEVTDRGGRIWRYANYNSPSGPASWLELPEEFWPPGAGNFACHFDGAIMFAPPGSPALSVEELRREFLRLLTADSPHHDRRRKDFNQALFSESGLPVWSQIDLGMVMSKFEKAAGPGYRR